MSAPRILVGEEIDSYACALQVFVMSAYLDLHYIIV